MQKVLNAYLNLVVAGAIVNERESIVQQVLISVCTARKYITNYVWLSSVIF